MSDDFDDGYDLQPVFLGTRPFILVEITGVDTDGNPQMEINSGGGLPREAVAEVLAEVAALIEQIEGTAQSSSQG